MINLTQHAATPEQVAAGVAEPTPEVKAAIVAALTFADLPVAGEIAERATALALIAAQSGAKSAMIGGAPYLMGALERVLRSYGVAPCYAFSRRESVEETLPDGSVRKVAVFRHAGFVRPEVAE